MSEKLCIGHLSNHLKLINNCFFIGDRQIDYVWIQGIIVSADHTMNRFLLDDGTGTILVSASNINFAQCKMEDYVAVQGLVMNGENDTGDTMMLVDAQILSVIEDPNMETIWFLEVSDSIN